MAAVAIVMSSSHEFADHTPYQFRCGADSCLCLSRCGQNETSLMLVIGMDAELIESSSEVTK
eukprot:5042141-Pleurochrysis_carterae.AAC.4